MATIVPAVSSGTAGPLGVIHLPRLWLKLTLSGAGKLPEGYDECGAGFDGMTISALGLNRDAVIEFVKTKKPTYVQFEEWVVSQSGGSVDKAKVDAHNAAVRGYNHSDELGAKMRAASGLKDSNVKDAVMLNFLEDLDEIHREVTGKVTA
jgi:hypothetical protein